MPPTKQHLDEAAWKWTEDVEPEQIQTKHLDTVYRMNIEPCERSACR